MSTQQDLSGLQRSAAKSQGAVPMPKRPWRPRLVLPLVVCSVLGLVAISTWDLILPGTKVEVSPVIVKSIVGAQPGTVTVQAPGWLEPDPFPSYVSALTSGIISEVLVLEGERIETGQVVARLIDDDAKLARERADAILAERRAAVLAAKTELEAAETTLKTLVEHTEAVEKARAGIASIVAEKKKLVAEIAANESRVLATEDELNRKSRLVASQAVPRGSVERLKLRFEAEKADLEAEQASQAVLDAKLRIATVSLQAAEKNAELLITERRAHGLAQASLQLAGAAERRAEVSLAEADLRLARTEIRAAMPGIVLRRLVVPGSRMLSSSMEHSGHILHVYDPSKIQVRVDVPLADAAQVGLGQSAKIIVDALPDEVFSGTVSRLVHVADISKNTIEVKVSLNTPSAVLKPEMLARVRFLARDSKPSTTNARQHIFVPSSAIRQGEAGEHVFVAVDIDENRGRVESRPVEIGDAKIDDHVEVTKGLRPGDRVVVKAPSQLEAGQRIVVNSVSGRSN